NFVSSVVRGDRMFLAERRRFVEDHVERSVFLLSFLDEVQVFAVLVAHARDAQRRQQTELQNALTFEQRLKGNRGAAEKVTVFPNDSFDVVAARPKQPLFLLRACRVRLPFGPQMLGVPDSVV